ncbi:MAG: radical SAM/SPASM domain-containing protein [Acidobacteria bacterium]|nr:radical SAM/SPASM domain-containing protein [Acidobacteriota bacterium]
METVAAPVATLFDFITADHFAPQTHRTAAIELFQRSVSMVEIETFSYCNRRCWFCPNSVIDRHSGTEYMSEDLYLRVVGQLAEADYRGMISYSRYNEPLADRIILRRLEQARAALPGVLLHANTNGDYLTTSYLTELASAGLGSLNIQIYLANEERYDHERMRSKLFAVVKKLGLTVTIVRDEPDVWLEATAEWHSLKLRLYARNFEVNGCNRGESVPIAMMSRRMSPCLSPFYHVYIDYNGKVMPCCNLRSDQPAHHDAVVADLNVEQDLFLIYASHTMAAWRRSLVGFGPKAGHCASCSFVTFEATPANRAVHERLVSMAAREETLPKSA